MGEFCAQAVEDRSQHKNRASALARLRALLALKGDIKLLLFVLVGLMLNSKIALHYEACDLEAA